MSTAASTPIESSPAPVPPSVDAARLERVLFEIKRVIVGQDRLVERMLVALLAKGHVLLEGVPGVAKTLAVETLARAVGGTFARLQFTPDLVPADIIGTRIYKAGQDAFDVELGPVFANFVLTDEINRAPAKVQSALLEVMAERQVSIGGVTHPLPDPFLVLATQNPIESEGVYPLPEAQRDRFLMKVLVDYPSPEEEREIVYRMGSEPPVAETVLGPDELMRLQKTASQVFVHHALVDYVVRLVVATRSPREHGMEDVATWVSYGASPRASLGLIAASRALALVRGRDYVLPQDVLDVTADVLRHRLVLSYDALADGVPADHIVKRIVQTVPLPQVAPRQNAGGFGPERPGRPARAAVRPAPGPAAGRGRAGHRRGTAPRAPTGTPRARRKGRTRRDPPSSRSGARPPRAARPRAPGAAPAPGHAGFRDRAGRGRRRAAALHRRPDRRAAAPAGAHRAAAAGRAAAGRPPRAGARLRLGGRRLPHLPPRGRRPADGLAGHGAHPGAARPRDDRRPRARDVGGRRPVGQPRLRHRQLPEARPRDRRARRGRPPHRARRQPARRRRHHGRAGGPLSRRCPAGWPPSGCCARSSRPRGRPADGGATWPPRWRRCAGRPRRRGLVVVISDFLGDSDWERPLRGLSARHELLAIEVVDPRELELPDVGLLTVVDPESGQTLEVPTGNAEFRARFAEGAAAQRAEIATALRRAGAGHLQLRTDRDWLMDVVRFVAERRRAGSGGASR